VGFGAAEQDPLALRKLYPSVRLEGLPTKSHASHCFSHFCASGKGQPNVRAAIPKKPNFSGLFQVCQQVNSIGDNAVRPQIKQCPHLNRVIYGPEVDLIVSGVSPIYEGFGVKSHQAPSGRDLEGINLPG
jgi:hypothetical protein